MSAPVEDATQAFARLYDLDMLDEPGDLDLYLALARRTGGPILEVGVGTGRVAVPLVEAGYQVTGVDVDPAMLARARQRAADLPPDKAVRLHLVEADALTLGLESAGTFHLAFVALNSLMLLGDARDQARALRVMADHLAPGGLAVADVWLPDADDLARFDGRLILEYVRTDPASGTEVVKSAGAIHDAASQIVRLTTIYEEGRQGSAAARWIRQDVLRLVGTGELAAYAEAAGLTVEVIAGGYDLEPLGSAGERSILVAVKPGPAGLI